MYPSLQNKVNFGKILAIIFGLRYILLGFLLVMGEDYHYLLEILTVVYSYSAVWYIS